MRLFLCQKVPDISSVRTHISFDGHTEGQADRLQLGEHQIAPLPFEKAAVTEQTPIVAFAFGLGDEP